MAGPRALGLPERRSDRRLNGWWLVGLGGAAGAILRYTLAVGLMRVLPQQVIPYGTLAANVIGCFAIGSLMGWAGSKGTLSNELRLLLVVGLLGGFTTFSSFGLEVHMLAKASQFGRALLHVGLNLSLALAAVWVGFAAASR